MKFNQIVGDTQELRFQNIAFLKEKAKKWGVFFGAAYALIGVILIFSMTQSGLNIFVSTLMGLSGVIFGYLGGKAYGWAWYWFKLKGGDFGDSVSRSLDDALFGYFFIGSKSFVITLVMLGIFVGIGFYIGVYCMIRYEWIEYKKLKKATV